MVTCQVLAGREIAASAICPDGNYLVPALSRPVVRPPWRSKDDRFRGWRTRSD